MNESQFSLLFKLRAKGYQGNLSLYEFQTWLRDLKKIDVLPINDGGVENYGYRVIIVNRNLPPVENKIGVLVYQEEEIGMLEKYENALEYGIKYCVELI